MENMNEIMIRIMNEALSKCKENFSYRGYRRTIMAWKLVWKSEENFRPVKQNIYEVIAQKEGCTPDAVCSAIRKMAELIWKYNSEFLRKYNDSLSTAPSNSEFLVILLRYLCAARGDGSGSTK